MREQSIAGAILAGGRSSRLGGAPKALLDLDGRPMLAHVIERFRPQVGRLVLSVEQVAPDWNRFGLAQVADPRPGFRGPLGGLSAAIDAVEDEAAWLALAPCDAPFLPTDLVDRLRRAAPRAEVVVVRLAGVVQPTFSLWRTTLAERLRHAVRAMGMAGFRQFLAQAEWTAVDWPEGASDAFYNINEPAALAAARRRVAASEEERTC